MPDVKIPHDLDSVIDSAWEATRSVPGHLGENEARFLSLVAACAPATGAIVEIGSFKGRSTVMLAKVASHYSLGPIVSIDPHNSPELFDLKANPQASSYTDFLHSLASAGVTDHVEVHVSCSAAVAPSWTRPIRFLWIDGDHSYEGAKTDLDGFLPHLVPGGIVAFHDALNAFPGPIRVFTEEVLRSGQFGAAGFVQSIAWAQFRPEDGHKFQSSRRALDRSSSRLIPLLQSGKELRGLAKKWYKFNRYRVPHAPISPSTWASLLNSSPS